MSFILSFKVTSNYAKTFAASTKASMRHQQGASVDDVETLGYSPPRATKKGQRVRFADTVEILEYDIPCHSIFCRRAANQATTCTRSRHFLRKASMYENHEQAPIWLRPLLCFFCVMFIVQGTMLLFIAIWKCCENESGIPCQITRVFTGLVGCMTWAFGAWLYYDLVRGLKCDFQFGCAAVAAALANSIGALCLGLKAEIPEQLRWSVWVLLGLYVAMCVVTIEPADFFERCRQEPGERKPCRLGNFRTREYEEKCEV